MQMWDYLDFSSVCDVMFWAAAMVMFFCTLRKSNLFPNSKQSFDVQRHFVRSDFLILSDCMCVTIKWTKTNQFQRKKGHVTLQRSPHILCPVTAVDKAFKVCKLGEDAPAFVCDVIGTPMTGQCFTCKFKCLVEKCGLDPKGFASHSFRRGSATWAMQCGVPSDMIKIMGDWSSNCYQKYVDQIPVKTQDHYRNVLLRHLPHGVQ